MSRATITDDSIFGIIADELINVAKDNFVNVKRDKNLVCGIVLKDDEIDDFIQSFCESLAFSLNRVFGINKNRTKGFISKIKKPVRLIEQGLVVYYWPCLAI